MKLAGQFSLEDTEDFIQLVEAWKGVLILLQQDVISSWFVKFFKPLSPKSLSNAVATFGCPSSFVKQWVEGRFLSRIEQLLSDELGYSVSVEIQVAAQTKAAASSELTVPYRASVPAPSQKTDPSPHSNEPLMVNLDSRLTFDNFIVGQSNRLAIAGAKAVTQKLGADMNPLFIYGPNGVGKTHLLNAIAMECLRLDPTSKIGFVSGQQFGEDFVRALQENRVEAFRWRNRGCKVWLIDDIQHLASREKTCEEIFHTYNHLRSIGSQIIICSDRSPRDFHQMDERLRTRFEWGLVVDISVPDTELRCAILLSKAKQSGIELSPDVAMLMTEKISDNIRTLEGALKTLHMMSLADNCAMTADYVKSYAEKHYGRRTANRPNVKQIIDLVSRYYHIETGEVRGASRRGPIVYARHVAIFLAREVTEDTWKHIGSQFGNRDHSSVMHGYQKVEEMLKSEPKTREDIEILLGKICPEKVSSLFGNRSRPTE